MAKASRAKVDANRRYQVKNYDSKVLTLPKGAIDELKKLAEAEGESLNRYILEAIEQRSGLKLTLDGELKNSKK